MKTNQGRKRVPLPSEAGIVLVATLLIMTLIATIMAGMFAALNADQRAQSVDRDQTQVYAAAHAGLEKLTADLVNLFVTDVSPTTADINILKTFPPNIPGFDFIAPGGAAGSGYAINYNVDANGNPAVLANADITAGPYAGFKGLITPFSVTITARSTGGSEVRLRRDLQTVAVPVFQFGVFSDTDLTFYAGDDFDFGGRVHTNGHLYLSELVGNTLRFTDRITALGHVVRSHLSNGRDVGSVGFTGNVMVPTTIGIPGVQRHLKHTGPNEGSILGWPGAVPTPANNANWTALSVGTYKSNIRTGTTGAKRLDLPIVSQGARPIDLIRRPPVAEDVTVPLIYGQRYYRTASLRILLSDRDADIAPLPGITATPPIQLDGDWLAATPAGYGPVDATHPPIARSIGPIVNETAGGTYAAPFAQIYVNGAINDGFEAPQLTITPAVGPPFNVVGLCAGKTASTFFGCSLPSPIPAAGGTVSATLPSGLVVSAPLALIAVAAGPGQTLTLSTASTPYPTAPFSPGLLWVNRSPVTCEGYNTAMAPQRFTNCRGLTAVPVNALNNITTSAHVNQGVGTIGGFLKIEKQDAAGTRTDVTLEILNLGFGAANQSGTNCGDPTPNAVLRIQRLRDNGNAVGQANGCGYAQSRHAFDWWPQTLYDAREGNVREVALNTAMTMGGVMQYITLDVANLKRWLAGSIGATGNTTLNQNGYVVYFSDRRGNHDWTDPGGVIDPETGDSGWEDIVNPASATGAANGVLDTGEDVNVNTTLQTYGSTPDVLVIPAGSGATDPFTTAAARPWTNVSYGQAAVNRTVLFRRALKLINGGIAAGVNNLPTAGLTVVAENPVYVQGNYNATTDPAAEPNVPAAIFADAVTVLSNNWNDANSLRNPNDRALRPAVTTGYRFAVLAGKNPSFPWPAAGTPQFLFGTDGGAGNFLRLLENWNLAGVAINYRGSIVSLYFSRQATGTFRFSANVYSFGQRNFTFDTDFLTPTLLPAGTPMFRDVNTLTFRQILRPTQ